MREPLCNHLDECSMDHYNQFGDRWCNHLNECGGDHYEEDNGQAEGSNEDPETKANGFDNLSHRQEKV